MILLRTVAVTFSLLAASAAIILYLKGTYTRPCSSFTVNNNDDDDVLIILQKAISPIVELADGAVQGRVVRAANGRFAQEFLNIPYARPPVGALRFRSPEPAENWEGIRDGTQLGNACVQNSGYFLDQLASSLLFSLFPQRVSEDCLNINVHTPFPISFDTLEDDRKLPVIVWIHGGAFRVGSNTVPVFNGSILASEINAVVVVLNYRLGPLGFFSLNGVDGISGNQGLLDQALALKWTQTNVEFFGGDPERITIMGVSAGSASVHYHLLSPISRDLFARAIMQSGTALSFWSHQTPEHARQESKWFVENAGCDLDDNTLACFQSKTVKEILITSMKVLVLHQHQALFSPTTDGVFITKSPGEYVKQGDFKRGEVMLGTTTYEIMPLLALVYPFTMLFRLPAVLISETQFSAVLNEFSHAIGNASIDAIRFAYRNWSEPHAETGAERWRMLNAVADDVFMNNGVADMLDAYHAHRIPLYRYVFEHVPSRNLWGASFGGSVHADDSPFIMGHVLNPNHGYSNADVELTRRMLHAVSNFARTGSPSAEATDAKGTTNWPPYAGNMDYYAINADSYGSIRYGPERWRIEFWRQAVPYLQRLTSITAKHGLDLSNSLESKSTSLSTLLLDVQSRVSSFLGFLGINLLWILLPYLPL